MAGEGANLIGNAYIVPDDSDKYLERMDRYWQRNREYAAQQAQTKKDEQNRKDMLFKYVHDSFKDKDHATGTAYDPLLNNMASDYVTKYAQMIQKGGNDLSLTDLGMLVDKDAKSLDNYSANVKLLNKGITDTADKYKDLPGIDTEAVKKLAMQSAIYDDKGNLKPMDEIDLNKNYADKAIVDNPDLVMADPGAVRKNYVKNMGETQKIGDVYERNVNGIKTKDKFDYELYPFQKLKTDGKGYVQDKSGNPIVEVRGHQDAHGDMVADDKVVEAFVSHPEQALLLRKQFKQLNSKLKPDEQVPYDSPGGAELRKKMIYDELSQVAPKQMKTGSEYSNQSAWAEANRMNRFNITLDDKRAKDDKKEQEENFASAMGKVFSNDPNYLTGNKMDSNAPENKFHWTNIMRKVTGGKWEEHNNFVNIASAMPKGIIFQNKQKQTEDKKGVVIENGQAVNEPYYAVWYNPDNGKIYTQDETDSKPEVVKDRIKWLKSIATANGMKSEKQTNEMIKKFTGANDEYQPYSKEKNVQKTTAAGAPILK